MIWFNLKKLEDKLANNEVPEKAGYEYLLAWIVFFAIGYSLPDNSSYSHKAWDICEGILKLAMKILMIIMVFRINRNGTNQDFLKRFLSLSFVILLRIAVLFVLLFGFFRTLMQVISQDAYEFLSRIFNTDLSDFIISILMTLIYFFLVIRSFRKVNNGGPIPAAVIQE